MVVQQILATHPQPRISSEVQRCIDICFECSVVCTSCADACLAESEVDELVRCIGINQNCAAICDTTGEALLRQVGFDWNVTRAFLQACVDVCRICRMECEMHATMHEHCRLCAEVCSRCEDACRTVLEGSRR